MKPVVDIAGAVKEAGLKDMIIPAFNVFGYEDSLAIVRAAEKLGVPVILMTNRDALGVLRVETWGAMLSSIARCAAVPVGVHLDHNTDKDVIFRAIDCGYSSVMYDGSQLPLAENIKHTKEVARRAHANNVAIEGEIGSVPYSDKPGEYKTELTSPAQAKAFAEETGIDWMAVSVGNVHRLLGAKVPIDFKLLQEIQDNTDIPLIIHGASGITDDDIRLLRKYRVGKINIGTVIRHVFGSAIRRTIEENPAVYDRLALMKAAEAAVEKKAAELFGFLCKPNDD